MKGQIIMKCIKCNNNLKIILQKTFTYSICEECLIIKINPLHYTKLKEEKVFGENGRRFRI